MNIQVLSRFKMNDGSFIRTHAPNLIIEILSSKVDLLFSLLFYFSFLQNTEI